MNTTLTIAMVDNIAYVDIKNATKGQIELAIEALQAQVNKMSQDEDDDEEEEEEEVDIEEINRIFRLNVR